MERASMASAQMLLGYDLLVGPTPELAILGDASHPDTAAVLAALRARYWPNKIVALTPSAEAAASSPSLASMFAGKQASGAEPTLYVCENFTCQAPIAGKDAVIEAFERLSVNSGPRL
jgi:uncharacterized protein YyaL (SSP411 family)